MLQIPDAPYYMAVFTSNLSQVDNEYHLLDDFLMKKIENIDGYFDIESVRNANNLIVFIVEVQIVWLAKKRVPI